MTATDKEAIEQALRKEREFSRRQELFKRLWRLENRKPQKDDDRTE